MRVVAHDQVRVEASPARPAAGTARERLRGDREPVADARGLDHDLAGGAADDLAADERDHRRGHPSAAFSGAPLAWQMATARASAAWSGSGGSGSESSAPTMRWTWSLAAEPEPQTACLTACGV